MTYVTRAMSNTCTITELWMKKRDTEQIDIASETIKSERSRARCLLVKLYVNDVVCRKMT